jgi:hypothetical protein
MLRFDARSASATGEGMLHSTQYDAILTGGRGGVVDWTTGVCSARPNASLLSFKLVGGSTVRVDLVDLAAPFRM